MEVVVQLGFWVIFFERVQDAIGQRLANLPMYFLQTMHFAESMLHQRKVTSPVATFEGNLAHVVGVCSWTDEEVEHLLGKA